jgi:hypothetical protein
MKQREWDATGMKGFLGEAQQHRRIFPDRIKEYRALALGDNFAENVNTLRFELSEMG